MAPRKPTAEQMVTVTETFAVLTSKTVYRRGTIMPASDPVAKKHPQHFKPVEDVAKPSAAPVAPKAAPVPVDPELVAEG